MKIQNIYIYISASSCDSSSLLNSNGHPRKRIVLLLSSSWNLSSAFSDPITQSGSTSESKTLDSFASNVMHSKKDDMFLIPGFGGHVIASWDLHEHGNKPKFQWLRFRKTPCCMTTANKTLLDSCCKSEHLVESRATGETFMVKLYKKTMYGTAAKIKTEAVMVFKLDDNGNAVYTQRHWRPLHSPNRFIVLDVNETEY